jgi:hypothetical protein
VVRSGSSYCSQSELPLTFGLGSSASVDSIEVAWPSGKLDKLGRTPAGTRLTITEGGSAR